jgi:hypothetical protein
VADLLKLFDDAQFANFEVIATISELCLGFS